MTPSNMDNAEKLRMAQALVQEVAATLESEKSTCPCCGLTKYTDRDAYQTREQLDAVVQKLGRFANSRAITGATDENG